MVKRLAHNLIYYFGVGSIFLAVLAALLSGIGILFKAIGITDYSTEIFHLAMGLFSTSVGIGTYINLFFLHKDLIDMKEQKKNGEKKE
jgi:hypothetical protein